MAGWTGKVASVLLVFIATWGSAIMYWRSTGATPGAMDMLLYLGLLPAGVSSAGFMATGLLRQGADKALEAATRGPDNDATSVSHEGIVKAVVAASMTAGQINLGVGLGAPALLAAAAGPPRPALSARFRDGQNLPIRVSEAAHLDELEVLGEREQGIDTAPRERRALALLVPVLDELLGQAAMALPVLEAREEVVIAGLRRNDEGRVGNVLTIELLVAHGWSDALLHWVRDWLMQRVFKFGIDARRLDVGITVVGGEDEAWRHLHRLADTLSRKPERWHLLLACDSSIDLDVIQGWLANGVLATAHHPEGKTPGEGAAGVLLASPGMATEGNGCLWPPLALEADAAQFARPAERRRHLTTAASQWKQSLPQDEHGVQFVLHDARHSGDSVVDAALAASALNPDMEFGAGNLSLPACAGELGPVLPVAMLALALEQTRRNTGPVLILAGTEAQQRVLALVSAGSTPQTADLPSTT